jgi:hypothetical protein
MRTHLSRVGGLSSTAIILSILLLPAASLAQWGPEPGHGSLSLGYQFTRITDHFFSINVDGVVDSATGYVGGPGKRYYLGDVYGQSVYISAAYGIWRGLSISGSGTYLTSKYDGKFPEAGADDGRYHGSIQDGSFSLQYMYSWQEFAITPSVGLRLPLSDYSTLGHVSVGKHLREVPLGISVGRSLSPLLPRAFLSGSFTYAFVQNHHEHSLDQRHFAGSAGYIVTNSLSVGGFTEYVNTIDGLDWALDDLSGDEEWHDHDVAAKASYLRVGGYVSLSLGQDLGIRLSYLDTVSGENSHAGRSITFEPTWSFTAPLIK